MQEENQKTSETPEQVEYNLSSFKIGWIAQLIQQADICYLKGNTIKAFYCWKCIHGQIDNRIDEEEDKTCISLDNKFHNCKKKYPNYRDCKNAQNYYYGKYKKSLQKLLKKYGFDMKEKESNEYLV